MTPIFYFTTQGGAWKNVNTIWVWPALALSQHEEGFEMFGKRKWLLACSWIFWTAGVSW